MKEYPLVSIIIPLYNGANYVRQAIDSALAQTYPNIQIIVVNDGSTDGGESRAAVLEYDNRVTYYEKPNGGCASALNYGIEKARGQYISWLSHDDLYHPQKIEKEMACYDTFGLDKEKCVISCRADMIDADGNKLRHPKYGKNGFLSPLKAFEYLLFSRCFNGCGLLIPKAAFTEKCLFREDQKFLLDWNLWLRFALAGVSFYLIEDELVSNRSHSAQITRTHTELHRKEREETVEQLCSLIQNSEPEYAKAVYRFAYMTSSPHLETMKIFVKERNIAVSPVQMWRTKAKSTLVKCLKRIYKKFK